MESSSLLKEVSELVAGYDHLNSVVAHMKSTYVDAEKFYNVALSTEVVASLHQVSPALVRKYISLGMIDTHPMSSQSRLLVRASDALRLDFKEMKIKAKERCL